MSEYGTSQLLNICSAEGLHSGEGKRLFGWTIEIKENFKNQQ